MKRKMTNGTSRPAHAFKTIMAGTALCVAFGFSMNAQAQDCTTGNWANAVGSISDANVGTQGADNRRYGGPCGLRVELDGDVSYLESPNLVGESNYNVRFYAFLDAAGSDPIELFQTDAFSIFYENGDVTLAADIDAGADTVISTFSDVETGWHSIEVAWESSPNAEIAFLVANRNSDMVDQVISGVDTSDFSITFAHLGNVNGATGGSIDFDDFVSTRVNRPGRLMIADTNDDEQLNVLDIAVIGAEVVHNSFADGQPDCDENGTINVLDIACVGNIIVFGE